MGKIPGPEEITPKFITECLRSAGHERARVRGLHGVRVGTGQIGQCIRYELEFEGDPDGAPPTLVAKFASDDATSRQTGVMLGGYLKEVSFYQNLQSRLGIRTPRCYHAVIEDRGPDHLLLLEDLAPAVQGDQMAGCSAVVARAAVQELVGLHAPTWCDADLSNLEWLGTPNDMTIQFGRALYQSQVGPFLERFRERLDADEVAIIERVAESQGPPFELVGDIFSLVHVDYRLDNLMIDSSKSPPSIAAVDWQSLTLGNPLSDVAYFLGAGLLPEARREIERGVVQDYHGALMKAGVSDYEQDRCWNDYRRGAFAGFAVTVIAAPMVEQTQRGDEMFTAMARRHARHALDLGSEEFLG